jgi:hypothetical protein
MNIMNSPLARSYGEVKKPLTLFCFPMPYQYTCSCVVVALSKFISYNACNGPIVSTSKLTKQVYKY